MNGGAADGHLYADSMNSAFSGYSYSLGTAQDLNGDGNVDLGSNNLDDADGWWIATAPSMQYAGTNGTSWTWYLGTIAFQVDDLLHGHGTTEINFSGRGARYNGALWKMDGVLENGSSPDIYVGAPVVLTR